MSVAQVEVKWQKWPANLQLYPRDNQNKASVPIVGQLQTSSYSHASVVVFKNGVRWQYQRIAVLKNGRQSQIQFSPTIEAGLNQYKFMVYAVNGKDSVLVDSRDNIVCGDVILCNGQSNLTGYFPNNYSYRNNFTRTFGNTTGSNPDTLWRLSNVQDGQVGLIGMEIQRLILENFNMPTLLINASVGGTSIKSHMYRNPANPADYTTLYGRLLYWAQKAGVADRVKAFIWRQGENEAGGGSAVGYEADIQTLFGNWQKDYPNVGKYYVAQVNLLPDNNKGAAQLRDFQRRTSQLFLRTEPLATVGLPAYAGVHYGPEGQYQFAKEVFRLIARDAYQSTDVNGISSPAIQKAYYKTAEMKEVVLEFEPGAKMVWKQDTVVEGSLMDIRDFIYFDYANVQQERVIASGVAEGNRITLTLTKPISASTITYLPNSYKTPFSGPFLKNTRGMRALTFHKVTIENAPTGTPPIENPPTENPPTQNPPVDTPPTSSTNPPGSNYGGSLDGAHCDNIWGWVYNKDYPNAPITVEFLANNVVVGSIVASNFRQDLKSAGKGNGEHGFNFAPPASLKTGQNQAIKARVVGTTYFLPGGAKNVTCTQAARLSAESIDVQLTVSVYPNPSNGQLTIRFFVPDQQPAFLHIFDVSGRSVWQKTVTGAGRIHEEVVDVPTPVTHTILVAVQMSGQKVVRKIILTR
ncbi:sialate O-acetylesterase [Larkinella bovis]|uniref:Sialate O-acetylesterase n=1 Tax=Larkinella bovis TaxID=683041 RepID=A0ABW0I3W2_9BACT